MSSTSTALRHHNTDADLYVALVRLFGEKRYEQTRWVTLNVDGVTIDFYGPREDAPDDERELLEDVPL